VLGVAAGLVVAELALRAVAAPGRSRRTHIVSDPVLHHRLASGVATSVRRVAFETNTLGLRDREIQAAPTPGTTRILMLGDSFTEGGGLALEDTVAKRAEAALNDCGGRWEVVNGGVGSYSPLLQYLFFRHVGRALGPELVVVNFDMTDLHDDAVRTPLARLDARGLPLAVPPDARREAAILLPPAQWPRGLGMLAALEPGLNDLAVYQAFRKSGAGRWMLGDVRLPPERLEAMGLVGDVRFDLVAAAREVEGRGEAAAWAVTGRHLVALGDEARAGGARFALVVYPHPYQVSAEASAAGRRRVGVGPGLYRSERPFRILEALGRREQFPVVSLLEHFRARHRRQAPLFWDDDIHHTPRGAAVFADGIVTGLRTHGLVPACKTREGEGRR
jgi:hypothetical protein